MKSIQLERKRSSTFSFCGNCVESVPYSTVSRTFLAVGNSKQNATANDGYLCIVEKTWFAFDSTEKRGKSEASQFLMEGDILVKSNGNFMLTQGH